MMNIIQIEEALKSFSQDQLVGELNQPSGNVPEFLVLTELGRRNRIKSDMDRQQAENQPTVAEEVINAAGVPQGGIRDIARSLDAKSSIEQNTGVTKMKEGGKVAEPKNRFEMLMAFLRGLKDDEETEESSGKSIAELINFGGDYDTVKKSDGGVVKMNQGTVVYKGKRYFTDGTFVAEKKRNQFVPVDDPEIVAAVTKKTPSVETEVDGLGDVSTNLDTFDAGGVKKESSVSTPDPMFTVGNQMPPIAASEDKVDKSDLPTYDGGMPFPLVKDKNFTLKPYEGPSIGSFDATGTGSSENKDTISNIPKLSPETAIESPDLKSIFEGSAIQYPDEEGSKIKGLGETNKILPDSVSTQAAPDLQAMNLPEQPTLPIVNIDNTSNLPDFSTNKDLFRGSPFGPDFRESPQLRQTAALDAEQESLGADTFANLVAEQSLMDEGAKIAAAMDAEDKRLKPADKIDDSKFIDPTKKDPDTTTGSSLDDEIANLLKKKEKEAQQDKWLALAQTGLALMSSTNPTLGGAIGEAGQAGLAAFSDARDKYNEDKLSLLQLQQRSELAKMAAESKSTKKGPKASDLKAAAEYFDQQLEDLLTVKATDVTEMDTVRTYDELSEAEKQRYLDILIQKRAAEQALATTLFGSADFDATQ